MSDQQILEATLRIEETVTVNCPHCGQQYFGRVLAESARTKTVQTCKECNKQFVVVEEVAH